jgi:hypothetical protein
VNYAFVFRKQVPGESHNEFEKKLRYLISTMSEKSPKKISIQTFRGEVIVFITNIFIVGAVITRDANPTLVEMILARIVPNLDTSFQSVDSSQMRYLEERIQERIKYISYDMPAPVIVTLTLGPVHVEGEIRVTATCRKEQERLQEEIQNILDEEIPFFFEKNIIIEIKMEYSSLGQLGITKKHLLKAIHKIRSI